MNQKCDPGPQTSHKGQFYEILIYASSEKLNKWAFHWCMVCYDRTIFENLESERVQKNQNIEKITFKVVQMKFLAMHITNQILSFDIFTVGNLQNIFMEHNLIFGI